MSRFWVTNFFVFVQMAFAADSVTAKDSFVSQSNAMLAFSRTKIVLDLKISGRLEVNVLTAKGQKIQSLQVEAVAGKNGVEWNGNFLPRGSYFVCISQKGNDSCYKWTLYE